ncbi:MacB-like core domain-containing protein [Desulfonatronum thiosulfatophilum]|uniref:MacB-like core domain-containing protein n=1 Tax=Desulfonatronum thiosulfatophilum TaxID=617002 RepID=A0A1G6AJT0_9BACT|nr:FtsX-like permease family protein [Desulfonatronum thiosulfatophilum]SDB08655.1 MacB-like core domain-containing protein [Desulfonatronum thiosulfatophilum]
MQRRRSHLRSAFSAAVIGLLWFAAVVCAIPASVAADAFSIREQGTDSSLFIAEYSSEPAGETTAAAVSVTDWVTVFSDLGDRIVGSDGNVQAADIIERAFADLTREEGRIIGRQSFAVPVQQHVESSLTMEEDGRTMPLRPLRLNMLSAPAITPPGITAPVIYAGTGRFSEFNGHVVEGAVVLMDMDSGKNWINASMLGASALIYVDPGPEVTAAPRNLFEDKLEQTPIDFPRFWMTETEAADFFGDLDRLREPGAATMVILSSQIAWENMATDNIYCLLPGTDPELAGELTVVQAFYDSTGYVPDRSPGADESVSIATLLSVAEALGRDPPRRPTLLLAAGGQAQGAAGVREFIWALVTSDDKLPGMAADLSRRAEQAEAAVRLLDTDDPFTSVVLADPDQSHLLRLAFQDVLRDRIDELSTKLMRLRLMRHDPAIDEPEEELERRIRDAAALRLTLMRLRWVGAPRGMDVTMTPSERDLLLQHRERTLVRQRDMAEDALEQLRHVRSSQELRSHLDGLNMVASASLHLSSHGNGVGAFDRGWLYELLDVVVRTRQFSNLDELLRNTGQRLRGADGADLSGLFHDTLRPSRIRPWQSWLPDRPFMGGEPVALAALPGFTLATVNDARAFWGTPYDVPEYMNLEYVRRQAEVVTGLVRALVDEPIPDPRADPQNGFAELTARVNLLRQGELFPDQPSVGGVFLIFQGPVRFWTMVDTTGHFHVKGLAIRRQTIHKAILEGFNFDPLTGRAVHAVDKTRTGLDNYRVRMRARDETTDLTMFHVGQSTYFSMLEPRTFHYLYVPRLIDSRTEAEPLRNWYSRLDTRASTLGTFFLERDLPLKLTLSDNFIDTKVVLLNADQEHPLGLGYRIGEWPIVPMTEYMAARDMWSLLMPRVENLEGRGIVNERIRELHTKGRQALEQAQLAREELRWDDFQREAGTSLAFASLVYNDVDRTQRDVLVGVLFYVALFIPFSYCMERLIFGFTDIHRRIVAFFGFMVLIIGAVYMVHPAFQLTYSPMVVILAFFILGLSLLVAMIIFSRFEREVEDLQRRSRHLKTMNISRAGAFTAAFILGVSNLRRRPLRTLLTCITLTILTFTIMNFTAVRSVRQEGWSQFSATASYSGAMMKYLGWQDMPVEALSIVDNFFEGRGVVAPRAWYITEDMTSAPMVPIFRGESSDIARGLVGLSHAEPLVSGLDAMLVQGRWFAEGERSAVILPEGMARRLGVRLESLEERMVTLWGQRFEVVGVLADDGLDRRPDLDGEPITPVFYPSEAAQVISTVEAEAIETGRDVLMYRSRYQHVSGDQTVIIPAETLLSLGGGAGRLKALAVSALEGEEDAVLAAELGERFGLMLFRGGRDGTSIFFAANAMSYQGFANILIPLLIAALIVLNTMIGSVHERKREIAVYTSVGLAPSHVGFLFLAESLALAVISVVTGYLLAQGAAAFLAGTPLWAGMTANYSSTAGVGAMALVIAVVLASTIYPARMAAQIAIPDVNRSWTMPKADGDRLEVVLPFLIKLEEQVCAGGFLMEYFRSHQGITHGAFSTDNLSCEAVQRGDPFFSKEHADKPQYMMTLRVWLAPFDFGIRQTVRIVFRPSSAYEGFREILVRIDREAGEHKAWQNQNKVFLNDLRKQLLVWRSLEEAMQGAYEEKFHQELADAAPSPGKDRTP